MRGTVLVIDGQDTAGPLVEALEQSGYFCLRARGPLKVREMLAEHTVDAIIWKENTTNPGLDDDLAGAWNGAGFTPVIHLFSGAGQAERPLPRNVVESMPQASAEEDLPQLLGKVVERARHYAAHTGVEHSELAFRNVVQTLRSNDPPSSGGSPASGEAVQFTVTGLNAAEREHLFSNGQESRRPSQRSPAPRRWFRRRRRES